MGFAKSTKGKAPKSYRTDRRKRKKKQKYKHTHTHPEGKSCPQWVWNRGSVRRCQEFYQPSVSLRLTFVFVVMNLNQQFLPRFSHGNIQPSLERVETRRFMPAVTSVQYKHTYIPNDRTHVTDPKLLVALVILSWSHQVTCGPPRACLSALGLRCPLSGRNARGGTCISAGLTSGCTHQFGRECLEIQPTSECTSRTSCIHSSYIFHVLALPTVFSSLCLSFHPMQIAKRIWCTFQNINSF